jgi:hypothetical protein
MEMSCQLHAPAALAPVPIWQEAGWTPEPIWMLWRREKSFPYREPNPDCPVCRLSLYQMSYSGTFFQIKYSHKLWSALIIHVGVQSLQLTVHPFLLLHVATRITGKVLVSWKSFSTSVMKELIARASSVPSLSLQSIWNENITLN